MNDPYEGFGPTLLGGNVVTQNPSIPFTPEQLARRRAIIAGQAGVLDDTSYHSGVGKFPVASQGNIALPQSHRLNPSSINDDNFTLQGILSVIGSGLLAGSGGLGGTADAGESVGELPYGSDPLAGAPLPEDGGPLTQYAQNAGPTSDVTASDINSADLSNINNPGAPAPDVTSSPLQASQDPLGSAGDPGLPSSQPLSLQDEQARYYKNLNDANAAKNAQMRPEMRLARRWGIFSREWETIRLELWERCHWGRRP